jgi:hypothetical protein
VKPLSRDGARIAFQELERIAGVPHVRGRGWYGLRRVATDIAETATTDDRVKDRLGGWQDSETRKQIYQGRETAELRTKAADVRRQIRLGSVPILADGAPPAPSASVPAGATTPDLDALVAALTPDQRAALAAKLNAPKPVPAAPRAAPTRQAPRTMRPPALRNHRPFTNFRRAGDRTRTGDVQLGKLAFYH